MRGGLRVRIIALVVFVSALTLVVAAVTLLSPLDRQLHKTAISDLSGDLHADRGLVTRLPATEGIVRERQLRAAAHLLRKRTRSDIAIFTIDGRMLENTDHDSPGTDYKSVRDVLLRRKDTGMITGKGSDAEADVAIPIESDDGAVKLILAARRPITDLQSITGSVTRAFLLAAAVGLAAALLAGLPISGRMATRVRRLRDTALRVAEIGPAAEMKPDAGRDEIGDLSRAFATMQLQLQEQEAARRAFVATASHELRTPLASLRLMLDLLIEDLRAEPADVEHAREQAGKMDRQAERLSQLTANLLDLSRIDSGVPLQAELIETDAIVRAVAAEFELRAEAESLALELDLGDGPAWAVGDGGAVAQIVRILLDNAVRYAEHRVSATVGAAGGQITVTVADDGPGVPADERDQIFSRFSRGSAPAGGGFGLGLAIGRELADRMDGELALDGQTGGGRFMLTLPAAPAA